MFGLERRLSRGASASDAKAAMKIASVILLVDDNDDDVELVQRALEKFHVDRGFAGVQEHCTLAITRNGLQALDYLHRQGRYTQSARPDFILLDINMPNMDGKKFLEYQKQDVELRLIPTIMLTSSDASADIEDCYARHANCYVVKPLDGHRFMSAVRQVVTYWSGVAQLQSHPAL